MIKFLTLSRRGPGPGLHGLADGYSPNIAWTGTLTPSEIVSQIQQFKVRHSNVYYAHECGIRSDDNREASGRSFSMEPTLLGTHVL